MFFERAKVGLNEWWRYFVGGIMVFFGWHTIAMTPVFILLGYIVLKGGRISMNYVKAAEEVGVNKNITLAIMLSSFFLACICLYLVLRYLHKKPFLSIVTSRKSFSWKRAAFGFLGWLFIGLVTLYWGYMEKPEDYSYSFDILKFLPLLIICVLLLPFQTSFEELLFRGYMMQGVGLVTGSRLLALFIPAIIFGLLHSVNPEVFKYGFFTMMPFYIGMGVFLGIMAIMDNGIEIPLGVHFANNLTAALFLNMENSALPTDALFIAKNYDPTAEIPFSLMGMVFFILLAAIVFRWKNWAKLIQKI